MDILHFDCFSGVSGNMMLGALINAGIDREWFKEELKKLKLDGYEVEISNVLKNGISGLYVDMIIDGISEGRKYEEAYSHHDDHHHHDETDDHHKENHTHDHDHEHNHRNLLDIEKIIDESDLSMEVKETAKNIFKVVAEAEAKVHGAEIEEVHFHEVGALDSILDIVGVAICLNEIKVDKISSTPLHVGSGFVKCQHGIIPVPAPATMEIIKEHRIPIYSKGIKSELVTPTGAAIMAAIVDEWTEEPEGMIYKMGYGAGTRDLEIPNVLRVYAIEKEEKKSEPARDLRFPF